MLTDEMKSMAYLINKEILKIFPYEYIKDVCSGEITMKEIIDQIMLMIIVWKHILWTITWAEQQKQTIVIE